LILVDTSIWIDHLRHGDAKLSDLLEARQVLSHPFVIGELSLGNLRQRITILGALRDLPRATVAADDEVSIFVDRHRLFGMGIGYVEAHLLAAVSLTSGTVLWTRDRHLLAAAEKLGLAMP
jgi:predicted nucleic acid-binding protein